MFIQKKNIKTAAISFLLISHLSLSQASTQEGDLHPFWEKYSSLHCPQVAEGGAECSRAYPTYSEDQNQIAVIPEDQNLALRVETIKKAKKSIYIQTFIFTADESGLHIAEILKQKKKEGVDVRIVVDSLASIFYAPQNFQMYTDLINSGIPVEGLDFYPEISFERTRMTNYRYHEKIWIVDAGEVDGIGIVGGTNIANEYYRVGPDVKFIWRDQDIIVKGPMVEDMETAFMKIFDYYHQLERDRSWFLKFLNNRSVWGLWNTLSGRIPHDHTSYVVDAVKKAKVEEMVKRPITLKWHGATAWFVHHRPLFKEEDLTTTYLNLIRSAEKEIVIMNGYVIPSKAFVDELNKAALRGVDITIITNSIETHDMPAMQEVSRYYYVDFLSPNEELIRQGKKNRVKIYEWKGKEINEGTIHAKYMMVDGKVSLVGSYNLNPTSFHFNSESAVILQSEALTKDLLEITVAGKNSDLSKSRSITIEEARKYHKKESLIKNLRLQALVGLKDFVWYSDKK